jgi:hypothetical protein
MKTINPIFGSGQGMGKRPPAEGLTAGPLIRVFQRTTKKKMANLARFFHNASREHKS